MSNTIYVSEEVKEQYKKEHGAKLRSLLLPKDDFDNEIIEVLAVVPSRNVVGQYLKFVNADPKKAQDILVKNTLVTHKEEVLADDGLFLAAFGLIVESLEGCSGLSDNPESDLYMKADALMSFFLHIPFPEQLSDEVWAMKWAQLGWLAEKGFLGIKNKE